MQSTSRIVSLMSIGVHVLLQSHEKTIISRTFFRKKMNVYRWDKNDPKSNAEIRFLRIGIEENEVLRTNTRNYTNLENRFSTVFRVIIHLFFLTNNNKKWKSNPFKNQELWCRKESAQNRAKLTLFWRR